MARVLSDEATSIWLEPWDESAEGIEFSVRAAGWTEYHQAKRQAAPGRVWTVRSLDRLGVLAAAKAHLAHDDARFLFVSMTPGVLGELTERARHADSPEALNALASGPTAQALDELADLWQWDQASTHQALRRFETVVIDEARLLELLTDRLRSLINGNLRNAIDVLSAYALDHVHQELRADDLWSHLRQRGFPPQQWWRDASVLARIEAQRDRYLVEAERLRAGGGWITRAEVTTVGEALADPAVRIVVVSGSAGVGKTSVLCQVLGDARASGIPTLPFRVDRLVPTQLPDDVGTQLGLPASPPTTLAGVAPDRTTLLVIDQLDAVSVTSGRNQQLFEVIDEILRQAGAYPFMRVVVACRQFDLENDHRLREIRDNPLVRIVQLGPLAEDQVRAVLQAAGHDPEALSENQLKVLTTPLNLRLFLDAVQPRSYSPFASVADLYAAFWDAKVREVGQRLGRDAAWLPVIDALCDEMNRLQALSADRTLLDEWPADRDAMVSEGVLVLDDTRVAFAHEGFFDYAFARRFTSRGGDLVGLLRSGDQQLFRRAQVRQILFHARDVNSARYVADLRALLAAADVRYHIKDAVLTLIGSVPDPREAEWEVARDLLHLEEASIRVRIRAFLEKSRSMARSLLSGVTRRRRPHQVLNDAESVRARIRAILVQNPGWFDLADRSGWFDRGLTANQEDEVDLVVRMLAGAQRSRATRVAAIVAQHQEQTQRWHARAVELVLRADLSLDQAFFEWFLEQVQSGALDELRTPFAVNGTFWDLGYELSRKRPEWAAEFAARYLRRRDALATAAGVTDPFHDRQWVPDPLEHDFFTRIAGGAPGPYATQLLPWMLDVMERTTRVTGDHRFDAWSARFRGEGHGARSGLLAGMEVALENLASTDATALAAILDQLQAAGFESADFLAARAFTFGAATFAERAAGWILDDPRRLASGYADSRHWVGRELLAAIWPHLYDTSRGRLEQALLAYVPTYERTADGRRSRGHFAPRPTRDGRRSARRAPPGADDVASSACS